MGNERWGWGGGGHRGNGYHGWMTRTSPRTKVLVIIRANCEGRQGAAALLVPPDLHSAHGVTRATSTEYREAVVVMGGVWGGGVHGKGTHLFLGNGYSFPLFFRGYDRVDGPKYKLFKQPALSAGFRCDVADRTSPGWHISIQQPAPIKTRLDKGTRTNSQGKTSVCSQHRQLSFLLATYF